ncbi:hypothetical protein [Micromonospora sp. NBC_01813]|uniref:hypothetical protein n=1 Tax=Micromonospora sp. NBC_01813 TaxID=2975988 RepID=UPI002DD9F5E5|nr:hypothetical protein [Micromonospora sp. NBC_01813]WSA12140.1 hypothetical protein OG958_15930 [Micromonospora sp. NBC_01813]
MLVPVCVLFVQLWRGTATDIAFAEREREGVSYLAALNELTVALVDAQSAAVARQPVNDEAVGRALAAVAEVDERIGASLRAQQRWTALRAAIEALADRRFDDPDEAFTAYRETTDLLLAQYDRIREGSNLVRDPEGDAYHLQDGAAEELPEAIVATGRFADLAVLLPTRPAQERPLALVELIGSITDVLSPADDLASNVQAAVESTESRTMSSNLLTQVDRFRRGMDAIAAAGAVLNTAASELTGGQSDDDSEAGGRQSGSSATPDLSQLVQLRGEAQASAAELAGTMLDELDNLIADRLDGLRRTQWTAVGALVLAIGLACAPPVLTHLGQSGPTGTGSTNRRPTTGGGGRHQDREADQRAGAMDQPSRWPELDPIPPGSGGRAAPDAGRWGPTVAAR